MVVICMIFPASGKLIVQTVLKLDPSQTFSLICIVIYVVQEVPAIQYYVPTPSNKFEETSQALFTLFFFF